MSARRVLVTGGSGFIGVRAGQGAGAPGPHRARIRRQFARRDAAPGRPRTRHRIRQRRHPRRRGGRRAVRGIDEVHHLAFVNGTATSTARPSSCSTSASRASSTSSMPAAQHGVGTPGPRVELGGLPDAAARADRRERAARRARPAQPALSYGGGKIISETDGDQLRPQAFRARADLPAAQCLRPGHGLRARHSAIRAAPEAAIAAHPGGMLPFPIQGSGEETRSFCHVDDLVAGVMIMREQRRAPRHLPYRHHRGGHGRRSRPPHGHHRRARDRTIARRLPAGGTPRRCPDIAQARRARLYAAGHARCRACRRRWTGIGRTSTCAASLTIAIRRDLRRYCVFPDKIARAAGNGASVPSNAARSAGTRRSRPCFRSATCRRSTRWSRSARCRGSRPWFPTELLHCANCELVQLGLAVDPVIIFPPEYPYTSGTTKMLRDNFAELYAEVVDDARPAARTIWSSTSARTTARCSRISRTAATACSASSRPRWARSPTAAASRPCSATSRQASPPR